MLNGYNITASVGRNGVNKPEDVIIIQILLNRVPVAQGRPNPQLKADGKIGPNTQDAIDRFQQRHQLGSDGRIDPGGRMLAKLNQVIKDDLPDPAPTAPIVQTAAPPARKRANAIVMGIWGRAAGDDPANQDNGIAHWIEQLRPQLTALGVKDINICSMSWNRTHNDDGFEMPATKEHVDELTAREANPSYIALIGHSYGGRAVCLLSRQFDRDPDYVALLDPVFGPNGDGAVVIEPRGAVIQNWYQRNAIHVVAGDEDCLGVLLPGLPLGIALGRPVPNAENVEVKFRQRADGTFETRVCDDGSEAPRHITHTTIDGDEFIWSQIINKIVSDIRNLAA